MDAAADGVFSPRFRAMSIGVLMSVTIVAFQSLGVGTAMPDVARDLGGLGSYGWAFSAFMLASVVGSVAAGRDADGHGPLRAYLAAIAAFAAGSLLAALAWSWGALLAGRALEGLGSGALGVVTYASASRAYPSEMYGRMLALMSSAWVLPSLAGPALAGIIAETTTWRWVFVFLLPFLPVAVVLTRPGLRSLAPVAGAAADRGLSLRRAGLLAAGLAAFLAALELGSPLAAVPLALAGLALAIPSLHALLPAGTLRAARGLPSGILVRGLLAVAFLGCDAFMPLALTELEGFSLAEAGIVISSASLSWSLGSFLQAGLDRRDRGAGRRGRLAAGLAVLLTGVAVTGAGLFGSGGGLVAGIGWAIAGFGIGMGYASVGALVLSQAPGGGEGAVSAALQLIETISIALFTGLGGVLVALGVDHGWDVESALATIVAAAGLAAAVGLATSRRVVPA
jgi:MFS family permease